MRRPGSTSCLLGALVALSGCAAGGDAAGSGGQGSAPAGAPAQQAESAPAADPRLAALRQRVEQNPDDDEARRDLAIGLHSAKLREEAVGQFEILAQRAPNARHLLDLALAYGSVSRYDEAVATYDKLLTVAPGHPVALHNLGNIALKRGQIDTAIDQYAKAIARKPDYLIAYYHLGDALRQAERYREAYRAYEQVLELEPQSPEELVAYDDALYRLASLDITMGAHERAGRILEELLRANPEHPSAYYAYGQVLLQLGRPEDAQRAFDAHMRVLAKQKPTGPMAHGE